MEWNDPTQLETNNAAPRRQRRLTRRPQRVPRLVGHTVQRRGLHTMLITLRPRLDDLGVHACPPCLRDCPTLHCRRPTTATEITIFTKHVLFHMWLLTALLTLFGRHNILVDDGQPVETLSDQAPVLSIQAARSSDSSLLFEDYLAEPHVCTIIDVARNFLKKPCFRTCQYLHDKELMVVSRSSRTCIGSRGLSCSRSPVVPHKPSAPPL